MMPDVPRPLAEVLRVRFDLERVVERLKMKPEILLQILGPDHQLFWQNLLRIQALSSALYKVGADVEREVVKQWKAKHLTTGG